MSELVWGIKNGDLDQVKDIVEKKVLLQTLYIYKYFSNNFNFRKLILIKKLMEDVPFIMLLIMAKMTLFGI